uniref:Succinate--CoA ligase [ADP-forming] subunit beta, mitochondrial n=1 Tax=Attheya septentrionalis TaxID=420275 RepID=A0A7S2U713_9STRA|mmetsp:Transcript_13208/g.23958  ORF Transcript_13208/g.23958 Transcript_13208/m.23958 type:complete len:421 (+) Transcript_13208:66-1328(+)|eukprot:CAMPEP_0198290524 /NCGR_PEP_ID=MMETSP1449-20131203/8353_1 /TAXON_ID=420275 /ORGANISM="Attheya septentrionalis, Strain CCMP2084" /LENGTH=420 /DNA_ID=CAMNT_0043989033 /DNA_START=67 /DNA_END=1329 /DNA_ORIENTATION=+
MISSACATLLRRAASRTAAPTVGAVRNLNLHEYQSARIMGGMGVNVPFGIPAQTVDEAVAAAEEIGDEEVVIKAQILAGGRGLGKFTGDDGLQGGVHVIPTSDVREYATKMLGHQLVTKQSGPQGKPVNTILIAKKMALAREFYFAIMMDRASGGPLIIACSEGGTSIEDLAESSPEKIIKVAVDPIEGLTDEKVQQVIAGLTVSGDKAAAGDQIRALYDVFQKRDCTMVEVNPLAEDTDGNLIAADAKIGFDDNAEFRQKDVFAQRDLTQEDPREVEANKWDLNYIGLDGSIGCMVNGAGLAMSTMDIISLNGGSPANFLDVGGGATAKQVKAAFEIITSDPAVKAILVNIFGGIMKCDIIAQGIIEASRELDLKVPVIVRLEGTNVDIGKQMLKDSGLDLITAEDLDDAAQKAVAAIQ